MNPHQMANQWKFPEMAPFPEFYESLQDVWKLQVWSYANLSKNIPKFIYCCCIIYGFLYIYWVGYTLWSYDYSAFNSKQIPVTKYTCRISYELIRYSGDRACGY